jgi:hypothetical protein
VCEPGSTLRVLFGDEIAGELVADAETVVSCNGAAQDVRLDVPYPGGSKVYVAAPAGATWSLLVSSETPPVQLTRTSPGWQLSGGVGPSFSFETHTIGLSGAGDGDDHVQVVLACTGSASIEVVVEDGTPIGTHRQQFEATCSPEGAITSQTFKVSEHGVSVSYLAPKGTWTALSILVPDATH